MTSRGTANVLTRATAILAGLFFVTSLVLSILAGFNRKPTSILPGGQRAAAPCPGAPRAARQRRAAGCSTNCRARPRRLPAPLRDRRCRSRSENLNEGPGNRPFGVMGHVIVRCGVKQSCRRCSVKKPER